jgi:hypothetical protein
MENKNIRRAKGINTLEERFASQQSLRSEMRAHIREKRVIKEKTARAAISS